MERVLKQGLLFCLAISVQMARAGDWPMGASLYEYNVGSTSKLKVALVALALLFLAATVWAEEAYPLKKEIALDLGNGVKLELVLIPAGKFMMGSPETEKDRYSGRDAAEVTISKPFYMGKYEVTQEQYEAVMGTNPSHFKGAEEPGGDSLVGRRARVLQES